MKKSLFVSLFACTALAVSACGGKDDNSDFPGGGGTNPGDDGGDDGDDGGNDDGGTGGDTGGDGGDGGDSGGGDDGGTGDSGGDGGSFIQEPDGGGTDIECDLWSQDCPDGEKCMPWANDGGSSWNATKCSPMNPDPKQPGDACTVEGNGVSGTDDCEISSMCWDVDNETNMGTCVAFCTGDSSNPGCDDPGTSCVITNEGVLILCLPNCDPLLQDCPDGQACYPVNETFNCAPDASGPDMGVAGDPCEYINACDPGLACLNADAVAGCMGSVGCCNPFCDLSDAGATCPGAGEECVAWYEMGMEPPGYENVGACSLPA